MINHCDKLLADPAAEPEAYWDNSSSNQLVRQFIDLADDTDRNDIEKLIIGESLEKKLFMNLTYDEPDKKELLWSVLYQTGYLTMARNNKYTQRSHALLVIPNREIRELFIEKVREWFAEKIKDNVNMLSGLYDALKTGDAEKAETLLNIQLRTTISFYDSYEGFYHGFLLGILKCRPDWTVLSNHESGNGRSDIQIKCRDGNTGIIIEIKCSKTRNELSASCEDALKQIEKKAYAEALYDDGFSRIWAYGIAFYKKSCWVRAEVMDE